MVDGVGVAGAYRRGSIDFSRFEQRKRQKRIPYGNDKQNGGNSGAKLTLAEVRAKLSPQRAELAGGPDMLQVGPGTGVGEAGPANGSGTKLQPLPRDAAGMTVSDVPPLEMPASYKEFTSQEDLGRYLTAQYHIRPPNELTSCETCHR